jgi:hypothetical protein
MSKEDRAKQERDKRANFKASQLLEWRQLFSANRRALVLVFAAAYWGNSLSGRKVKTCARCGKTWLADRRSKWCNSCAIITRTTEGKPQWRCAECLLRVGFGVKYVSRWTALDVGSVKGIRNRSGIPKRQRKPKLWGVRKHVLNIERWQAYAWKREVIAHRRGDERTHWGNHPAAVLWRALKDQARYTRDNTNYGIAKRIRSRVYRVLRGALKSAPTECLLGCTWQQLRDHLEARFKRGMTWDNYGSVWHIDHIVPCAEFDLSKPEQQRQCFHFSNLRPLSARENISKSDKVTTCQPELTLNFHANQT